MESMLRRLVLDQIEIVFIAPEEPVLVEADEGQIGQILMNLVVNARDAMPSGGRVTVSVGMIGLAEPGAGRFGIGFGPCAKLSVIDTGEGMDAETQAHLFEPFFTTKPPEKGSGLGLSIVYGVVRNLGGAIEVQSERGQGASFHIYLPPVVD
jgi:signal transduction histidine kinase